MALILTYPPANFIMKTKNNYTMLGRVSIESRVSIYKPLYHRFQQGYFSVAEGGGRGGGWGGTVPLAGNKIEIVPHQTKICSFRF